MRTFGFSQPTSSALNINIMKAPSLLLVLLLSLTTVSDTYADSDSDKSTRICKTMKLSCPSSQRIRLSKLFNNTIFQDAFLCVGEYEMNCIRTDIDKSDCFAGYAPIQLSNGEIIPLQQVQAGDQVLDANNQTTTVLGWLHRESQSTFNEQVPVSPLHLTWVTRTNNKQEQVMARDIRIGDRLGSVVVTSIRNVTSIGLYAPLTSSGTIQVGNMPFSCYSDINLHSIQHFIARYVLYPLGVIETASKDTKFTRLQKLTRFIPSFLQ
jgi:hypothetical protein